MGDEGLKTRRGYYSLKLLDALSGGVRAAFLSKEKAQALAGNAGDWRVKEMAFTLPAALLDYTHAFQWKRDGEVLGICLVARPKVRFVGEHGSEAPAPPDRVFMVFLTGEWVLHEWRWEIADSEDATLPQDMSAERFGERLK